VIDLLFPLRGDCVFPGYQYPLYAAVKAVQSDLAERKDVFYGPIENVTPMRGLLLIGSTTWWRVRVPTPDIGRQIAKALVGVPLRVGSHIVQPQPPLVTEVQVAPKMYAEMLCVRSIAFRAGRGQPNHREFTGWFSDKLRRGIKVNSQVRFRVGRRRRISVGPNRVPTIGYAVEMVELQPHEAWTLMDLGGRRHMGASMWLPGRLPHVWCVKGMSWMVPERRKSGSYRWDQRDE
jgi:CRISPR-associated protein Cas6